ncbi:hypothetical protein APHAL10511_008525 [Amanita phalloides]|nr:hypothetical protein APHAL10511_008525 [Amanita phalloides]
MPKNSGATFIEGFFSDYPEFDYDATAPVSQEYRRLKEHFDWMPQSQAEKKAKSAFGTAMGKQFASFYGTSVYDIEAWRALCEALGVDPIPETVAECRDIVRLTHVNLVDFIDIRLTGKPIKIFETEKELREYTKDEGKYYPKESAKESGVLRYLLRKILRAPKSRSRRGL